MFVSKTFLFYFHSQARFQAFLFYSDFVPKRASKLSPFYLNFAPKRAYETFPFVLILLPSAPADLLKTPHGSREGDSQPSFSMREEISKYLFFPLIRADRFRIFCFWLAIASSTLISTQWPLIVFFRAVLANCAE